MTVDSKYEEEVYAPSASLKYTFFIESTGAEAIDVYKLDSEGVYTQLTENFHFSFEFSDYVDPVFSRGLVNLVAPLSEGSSLVIRRKTPISTTFASVDGQPFPTEQFEYTMDKATFILQELEGTICDCRGTVTEESEVEEGDTSTPDGELTVSPN